MQKWSIFSPRENSPKLHVEWPDKPAIFSILWPNIVGFHMEVFWIILTGCLTAIACALAGSFLIVRNTSMISDAISHAILPGIVAAFLITGSRTGIPVLIGAASVGLLATFLIEFLQRKGRMQADASIGTIFTMLFAIGVIMITAFAGNVDIDPECVLYGEIAYVPLDMISILGFEIPYAVLMMSGVLLFTIFAFSFAYRQFLASSFDPDHARSTGINTNLWHYVLMTCVSLITVAAFDAVGAILVVALFIVPPASAFLLLKQLHHIMLASSVFGIIAAIAGYLLADSLNGSIAGAMATITGVELIIAIIYVKSKSRALNVQKGESI
jgi:manganese/zinc/iron transport system permease protein